MYRDKSLELGVSEQMVQDCPFHFKSVVLRYAGTISHVQSLKGGAYWTTIGFNVWHESSGTRLVTCDFPTNAAGEMEGCPWFYLFEINGLPFTVFVKTYNCEERYVVIEVTPSDH